MGRFNGIAVNWPKKSFIILASIGILLLTSKAPTIVQAQGCNPANGIWLGCEIALAGTDVIIFKIGD